MRYFIIAGEESGDLHGSRLIDALRKNDPEGEILGMGGDRMQKAGMKLWMHFGEMAVMGIVDVLSNIFRFKKLLKECKAQIDQFKPDRVILIDYGGFNLRIAKSIHGTGPRVDYYIVPKVWAWNEKRYKKLRDFVDRCYVIFPFEESYFTDKNVNATYVGNPVKEKVDHYCEAHGPAERTNGQVALLPGSRKQEIQKVLPKLLDWAGTRSDLTFVLALNESAKPFLSEIRIPDHIELVFDKTYEVLRSSELAIVTSGTATLETALLKTPQVVVYRTGSLNYRLGRTFIKVKYLSPVNLILGREAVRELIQGDLNTNTLDLAVNDIRNDDTGRIDKNYKELSLILGEHVPSEEVAQHIFNEL